MRAILTHFRIRLRATLTDPWAAIILVAYGVNGVVIWPGPSVASGEGWFLVEGRMSNWMLPSMIIMWVPLSRWASGSLTGTHPMPTLPIGVRGRAFAEAMVCLVAVMLIRIPTVLWLEQSLGYVALSTEYETVLLGAVSDTVAGAVTVLPLLLLGGLTAGPARSPSGDIKRWLFCIVLIVLALKLGLLTTPISCVLVGASLSCLVLLTADRDLSSSPSKKRWADCRVACYRVAQDPETQLRQDRRAHSLVHYGPLIVAAVALQIAAVLVTHWLGQPRYTLAVCTLIWVQTLFFTVMFRHALGTETIILWGYAGGAGLRGGDFAPAWSVLPVRREVVLRGAYLHGLIAGTAIWAVLPAANYWAGWLETGQLCLMDCHLGPAGWMLWSFIAVAPCLAGFTMAREAGDDALVRCSLGAMIALLPLLLILLVMHASGPLTIVFVLAVACVGGLPPLVHLQRPVGALENVDRVEPRTRSGPG